MQIILGSADRISIGTYVVLKTRLNSLLETGNIPEASWLSSASIQVQRTVRHLIIPQYLPAYLE